MIIDFHTHTFPEKIAEHALSSLQENIHGIAHTDGTNQGLRSSMERSGIGMSIILPIATKPRQCPAINGAALEINQHTHETGLLSFGSVHPDCPDWKEILAGLRRDGFAGIKLHMPFQLTNADDPKVLRIVDYAGELGLITVMHAGYDPAYPVGPEGSFSITPRLLALIEQVHPKQLVLAHMGGLLCWDDVEKYLAGAPVWFDTSSCLTPLHPLPTAGTSLSGTAPDEEQELPLNYSWTMSEAQFERIARKHGISRLLFGSDSPWHSQSESLEYLRKIGFSGEELARILGENAEELLQLEQSPQANFSSPSSRS